MDYFILTCKVCGSGDCIIFAQCDGNYTCVCKKCGQEEEN